MSDEFNELLWDVTSVTGRDVGVKLLVRNAFYIPASFNRILWRRFSMYPCLNCTDGIGDVDPYLCRFCNGEGLARWEGVQGFWDERNGIRKKGTFFSMESS